MMDYLQRDMIRMTCSILIFGHHHIFSMDEVRHFKFDTRIYSVRCWPTHNKTSRVQHISDLHSKFALGHTMYGSKVDIQSAAAEIRRGKKIEEERNHRAKI